MAFTPIPDLPTPPTLADPASFNTRAEAFVGALPATTTAINTFSAELNQLQLGDMSSYVYNFFKVTNAAGARQALGMDYASQAQAEAGVASSVVLSPLRGMQQITEWFRGRLATTAQAAAAAANDVIMTPLRVQDWFAAQRASAAEARAGTSNVKIMTPASTEQHMLARSLGQGQTRKTTFNNTLTRSSNTTYQNQTGRPIHISFYSSGGDFQIGQASNALTTVAQGVTINDGGRFFHSDVIMPGEFYRLNGGAVFWWTEIS